MRGGEEIASKETSKESCKETSNKEKVVLLRKEKDGVPG
jgi:hypothetical protein